MVELVEVCGKRIPLLSLALSLTADLMVDLQTQDRLPAKMDQVLPCSWADFRILRLSYEREKVLEPAPLPTSPVELSTDLLNC